MKQWYRDHKYYFHKKLSGDPRINHPTPCDSGFSFAFRSVQGGGGSMKWGPPTHRSHTLSPTAGGLALASPGLGLQSATCGRVSGVSSSDPKGVEGWAQQVVEKARRSSAPSSHGCVSRRGKRHGTSLNYTCMHACMHACSSAGVSWIE